MATSNKQKLAQRRNHLKMRLMGYFGGFSSSEFTDIEKADIELCRGIINNILQNWDKESKKLGLTPLPTYTVRSIYGMIFRDDMKKKEVKVFENDPEFIIQRKT